VFPEVSIIANKRVLQPHTNYILEESHTQVLQSPEKFAPHFFMHFYTVRTPYFFIAFFWYRRTLLEFGILAEFTSQQLVDSFSNDKLGESCLIDFLVHCMQHDDIMHKLDSFGYRVFVTTGFYVSPLFSPCFNCTFLYCFL
jgi:hypothetical protein